MMCDIRHHPMWQGQLTCASPTQGSHLCKSEMSAHAVSLALMTRYASNVMLLEASSLQGALHY